MRPIQKTARRHIAWLLALCLVLLPAAPASAENLFAPRVYGTGSAEYTGSGRMSPEQEKLVLDFMHAYYGSLARLDAQDVYGFYAPDAQVEADYNQAIWEVLVGVRAMQQLDLSLTSYSFKLRVSSVAKQSDGSTKVMAFEDSTQCFAAHPGVESKLYDMGHSFVMVQAGGEWKLTEHRQGDSLHTVLMNRSDVGERTGLFDSAAGAQRDTVLSQARTNVGRRATRGSAGALTADNPYNRAAAVSYAQRHVKSRNAGWPRYDRYGGNCQNFVSQALYNGGIPMDTTSPGLWKWYGHTPNTAFSATGRSASWSGVSDFLAYVRGNQGFGLVAQADAPYYSGEIGDIIHMGTNTAWKHTVLITEVVRDTGGQTVDYLIASNTANLIDFPVSAYYYTNQMLIKVYGWNNE